MQHINTFGQGIKRGMDYTILPQSSYTYLLNGTLVSRDEKGFVITGVKGTIIRASFSDLETPIGSVEFNGVLYIITEKIVDSDSFICVYSLKGSDGTGWVNNMLIVPNGPDNKLEIPSELLGFSRDRLLQVFAKESYDGSVDLYICDGLNPNAVINTGLDRDGKKTDNQYKEFTHSEQFSFFKSIVKVPEVDASVESIGNLKPGTYYFYLRYEDTSLNATPFIKEIGPINIYAGEDIVVGVENENEERVSKKIVLSIYDTDPIYNKVSIAVVYYFGSDGILSRENFMIDKSISIDKTVNYFTFTGDEPLRNITTEEIIADNIPYNTSETHLQLHNRYYGANWKRGNIDYDKLKEFARRVIPRAVLHKDNNFDKYHDINNSENEYMEKEIYPFGISFLIDGSFKTPVFPVCGWREGDVKCYDHLNVPDSEPFSYGSYNVMAYSFDVVYEINDSFLSGTDLSIVETGVIYGTANPISDSNKEGNVYELYQSGERTLSVSVQNANVTYRYRIYAKLSNNTYVYSTQGSVQMKSGIVQVEILSIDNGTNNPQINCKVASNDGAVIKRYGVCYSTSPNVDIDNGFYLGKLYDGSTYNITLETTPGTKYYIKAYVKTENDEFYSAEQSFTTLSGILTVHTTNVGSGGDIGSTTAILRGTIAPHPGITVSSVGICYSMSNSEPTINDNYELGIVSDDIEVLISGLYQSARYYFRAFASNEAGLFYGQTEEFTTRAS